MAQDEKSSATKAEAPTTGSIETPSLGTPELAASVAAETPTLTAEQLAELLKVNGIVVDAGISDAPREDAPIAWQTDLPVDEENEWLPDEQRASNSPQSGLGSKSRSAHARREETLPENESITDGQPGHSSFRSARQTDAPLSDSHGNALFPDEPVDNHSSGPISTRESRPDVADKVSADQPSGGSASVRSEPGARHSQAGRTDTTSHSDHLPSVSFPGFSLDNHQAIHIDNHYPAISQLQNGQSLTLTVPLNVVDTTGVARNHNLSLSVAKVNHAPVLQALNTELVKEDAAPLAGRVLATDSDNGDTLSFSTALKVPGFSLHSDGSWAFDPSHQAYQTLAEGQTQQLVIPITVVDKEGDTDTRDLTIVVKGTDDAPKITSAVIAPSATEDGSTVTGQVTASDVDTGDHLTFSTTAQVDGFTLNADGSYTFDPSHAAYQHLAAGEPLTLTIPVTVTDSQGATDTRDLTLTVTGSNDGPVLQQASASAREDGSLLQGRMQATDTDTTDTLTYSTTKQVDGFTLNADGSYTFDPSHAAYQSLAAGEPRLITIPVTVSDGHGGTDLQQLSIMLTGTDDKPVLQSMQVVNVDEDGTQIHDKLQASDVDHFDSLTFSIAHPVDGLSFYPDGSWKFDPNHPAFQHLAAGEVQELRVPVTVTDHSGLKDTQELVIQVTGTNDRPSITTSEPPFSLDEGEARLQGDFAATDRDSTDVLTFSTPAPIPGFAINAAGHWTFDPADPAYDKLPAGDVKQLNIPIVVDDGHGGTDRHMLQITLNGTDDKPAIQATPLRNVDEDSSIQGHLTATDPDTGDTLTFTVPGNVDGFSLAPDGSYTFDAAHPVYQMLHQDEVKDVTVPVIATDSQGEQAWTTLTFRLHGTNDTPSVIGISHAIGALDAAVGGKLRVEGDLLVVDADKGESSFHAQLLQGAYGVLAITPDGHWSYSADALQPALHSLTGNQHVPEDFKVFTADGTPHNIHLDIKGDNTPAVFGSVLSGMVKEDVTTSVTQKATIIDPDAGENHFQPVDQDTAHGHIKMETDGTWTYTLNTGDPAVQALAETKSITERILIGSADGTPHFLTVLIAGTNDAPVISGTSSGVVKEDEGSGSISQTLTGTDVDTGDTLTWSLEGSGQGTYGHFTLDVTTGTWTYQIDNSLPATNALAAGDSQPETFAVLLTDKLGAVTRHEITVSVNGTNDAPVIASTAVFNGGVTENAAVDTVSGTLAATDADAGATLTWSVDQTDGSYGSIAIDPDTGTWIYTLDNSRLSTQALPDGHLEHDTFTATVTDEHGEVVHHSITIDVTGTNDVASISGTAHADLREDTNVVETHHTLDLYSLKASGQLQVTDADQGEAIFPVQTGKGSEGLGSFALLADGTWHYVVDNTLPEIQQLAAGEPLTESFTVHSADGTRHTLSVTIEGTNDVPTMQAHSSSVSEDAGRLDGQIQAQDVDTGDTLTYTTTSQVTGFTLDADGHYHLDLSSNEYQSLPDSVTKDLVIAVTATDRSGASVTRDLTITVTGTNDAPVISGSSVATGSVTEDATTTTATGTLAANDVDAGASLTWSLSQTDGTYGSIAIDPDSGAWTYTLDNSRAATQGLTHGHVEHDTFTATVTDEHGLTQHKTITIDVTGSRDMALQGSVTGSVTEDSTTTIAGDLTLTDDGSAVAAGAAHFGDHVIQGTYGSLDLRDQGHWIYHLDNNSPAVQGLKDQEVVHDRIHITLPDGTTHDVVIQVSGTGDAPVIEAGGVAPPAELGEVKQVSAFTGATDLGMVQVIQQGVDVGHKLVALYMPGDDHNKLDGIDPATLPEIQVAYKSYGQSGFVFMNTNGWFGQHIPDVDSHAVAQSVRNNWDGGLAVFDDGSVVRLQKVCDGSNASEKDYIYFSKLADVNAHTGVSILSGQAQAGAQVQVFDGSTLLGTATADAQGDWQLGIATLGDGDHTIHTVVGGTASEPKTVAVAGDQVAVHEPDPVIGTAEEDNTALQQLTGQMQATDADTGDNPVFSTQSGTAGTYGTFSIDADGNWQYTLDNSLAATNALPAGQHAKETFVVEVTTASHEHVTQTVQINVTGANDGAAITGTSHVDLGEDTNVVETHHTLDLYSLKASGQIQVTDADQGEATFPPQTGKGSEGLGSFALLADGTWHYVVDNTQPEIQRLAAGEPLTERFTVHSADGTEHTLSVTITGTNDAATITGTSHADLSEDTNILDTAVQGQVLHSLKTSGQLVVADVDQGEATFVVQHGKGSEGLGTFVIVQDGTWHYAVDNTLPEIQRLAAGEPLTENFTVHSADGTAHTLSVTITGTNDAPVVTATNSAPVDLGTIVENTTHTFTEADLLHLVGAHDVDTGDTLHVSDITSPHGTFAKDAHTGDWTFTPATHFSGDDVAVTLKVSDGTAETTAHGTLDVTHVAVPAHVALGMATEQPVIQFEGGTGDVPLILNHLSHPPLNAMAVEFTLPGSDHMSGQGALFGLATNDMAEVLYNGDFRIADPSHLTISFGDGSEVDTGIDLTADHQDHRWSVLWNGQTGTLDVLQDGQVVFHGDDVAKGFVPQNQHESRLSVGNSLGSANTQWQGQLVNMTVSTHAVDPAQLAQASLSETAPSNSLLLDLHAQGGHEVNLAGATPAQDPDSIVTVGTALLDTSVVRPNPGELLHLHPTVSAPDPADTISAIHLAGFAAGTVLDDGQSHQHTVTGPGERVDLTGWSLDSLTAQLPQGSTANMRLTLSAETTGPDGSHALSDTSGTVVLDPTAPIPDATISGEDSKTTDEDSAVSGQLQLVDTDASQQHFQAGDHDGSYGKFSISADGHWTYAPDNRADALAAGAKASETFTVSSADGTTHDVVVNLTGTDDPGRLIASTPHPADLAQPDKASGGVLRVVDPDSPNPAAVRQVGTAGQYGSFQISAVGIWFYQVDPNTPDSQQLGAGQTAQEQFTVEYSDGSHHTLTIDILGTAHGPSVVSQEVNLGSVTEDATHTFTEAELLQMFGASTDAGADLHVTDITIDPQYGSFSHGSDGSWTFHPAANVSGDRIPFTVKVGDGMASTSGVGNLSITNVQDAPTITITPLSTDEDTAHTFSAADFGFTDADAGDTLDHVTITGLPTAAEGQLLLDGHAVTANQQITAADIPHLTFQPAANFNGDVAFKYTVNDGHADSAEATGSLTVQPVNDPVTVTADTTHAATMAGTDEDVAKTYTEAQLLQLVGASDVDGDTLHISTVGIDSTAGTFAKNPDGSWTFTPAANFAGTHLPVTVEVTDGQVTTAAHAVMDITGVADTPTLGISLGGAIALTADVALATEVGIVGAKPSFLGDVFTDFSGMTGQPVLFGDPAQLAHVKAIMVGTTRLELGAVVHDPVHGEGHYVVGGEGCRDFVDYGGTGNAKLIFDDSAPAHMSFAVHYVGGEDFVHDFADWGSFTIDRTPATAAGPSHDFSATIAEDTPLPLHLTVTDPDASEQLTVNITGLPAGASLNAGTHNPDGSWTLQPSELTGLQLTPAANWNGEIHLGITVTSTDGSSHAEVTSNLKIGVIPVEDLSTVSGDDRLDVTEGLSAGHHDLTVNVDTGSGHLVNGSLSPVTHGDANTGQWFVSGSHDGAELSVTGYSDTLHVPHGYRLVNLGNPDYGFHGYQMIPLNDGTASVTARYTGPGATELGGDLHIQDVDQPAATFIEVTQQDGDQGYGVFSMHDGHWTFETGPKAEALPDGQKATETFTFRTTDGAEHQVVINLTGSDTESRFAGVLTRTVASTGELDADSQASGSITIVDPDTGATQPTLPDIAHQAGDHGYGHFTLQGGHWTYYIDPAAAVPLVAGQHVQDTLTIHASDGREAIITIDIIGSNSAPAVSGSVHLPDLSTPDPITITTAELLAHASDVDLGAAESLSVESLSADHGSLAQASQGVWTYTPDPNYHGDVHFTYEVHDEHGGVTSASADLSVVDNNLAPVVTAADAASAADLGTTAEDTVITYTETHLLNLIGASDADGDTLHISSVTVDPAAGSFARDPASGDWVFTPEADFSGTNLAVSINVSDGTAVTTAHAQIDVAPVAETPTLAPADSTGNEDSSIALNLHLGLHADASETATIRIEGVPAGAQLSAGTRDPADGSWTLTPAQAQGLHVTPEANWSGTMNLQVTATSTEQTGESASTAASMSVHVNPDLDMSVSAHDITWPGNSQGIPLPVALQNLGTDASEQLYYVQIDVPDDSWDIVGIGGKSLLVSSYDQGFRTTITDPAELASARLIPPPGFSGEAHLSYVAAGYDSGVKIWVPNGSFTVTVKEGVATDGSTPVSGDLSTGQTLITAQTDTDGSYGSFSIDEHGHYTYTPDGRANALGEGAHVSETFTVTLADGSTSEVLIGLTGREDAPTTTASILSLDEDTAHTFSTADFGFHDVDAGDTLDHVTITGLPTAAEGQLLLDGHAITANQQITAADIPHLTFQPAANFNGDVAFKYTVNDGHADSAEATGTLSVQPVNDAPTVTATGAAHPADLGVTAEDTAKTFSEADLLGLVGAHDPDAGDTLHVSAVAVDPTVGSFSRNASSGDWTFTPAANYDGSHIAVSLDVTDGTVTTTAHAAINVTPVADTPTLGLSLGAIALQTHTETTPGQVVNTAEGAVNDNVKFMGDWSVDFENPDGSPAKIAFTSGTVGFDPHQITGLRVDGHEITGNIIYDVPTERGSAVIFEGLSYDAWHGASHFEFTFTDGAPHELDFFSFPEGLGSFFESLSDTDFLTLHVNREGPGTTTTFQTADLTEDSVVNLHITAGTPDSDETLAVRIEGVPPGATLSAGTANPDGSWSLTPDQLAGLQLTPAADWSGEIRLQVTATSTDGTDTADTTSELRLNITPVAETPTVDVTDASGTEDGGAIALDIGIQQHIDPSETTSVTIGGLPAGATLSAGHLNADGTYTLTPAQLQGLSLTPDSNWSGSIALQVTATATEQTGESAHDTQTLAIHVTPEIDMTVTSADVGVDPANIPADGIPIPISANSPDSSEVVNEVTVHLPAGWEVRLDGQHVGAGIRDGSGVPYWQTIETHVTLPGDQAARARIIPAAGFTAGTHIAIDVTVADGATLHTFNLGSTIGMPNAAPTTTATDATHAADLGTTAEDTVITYTETHLLNLVGASDADGDTLHISSVSVDPAAGSFARDTATGDWTFTPTADYHADDLAIALQVSDGHSTTEAHGTLDISSVNDAPTTRGGVVQTPEDTTLTFSAADFGFSDADTGDSLHHITISTLPPADKGTLLLNGQPVSFNQDIAAADIPHLVFQPVANANGVVNFTYTVNDGHADSAPANLMLGIMAVDDPLTVSGPAALGGNAPNTPLVLSAADLLAKADDVDMPADYHLTVSGLQADHGQVTDNGDGTFTFTPETSYYGPVRFTYDINETSQQGGISETVHAQANLLITADKAPTVTAVDDANAADLGATDEDTAKTFTEADLLQLVGAHDPDSDPMHVTGITIDPQYGSFARNAASGDWTFTPASNFDGSHLPVSIEVSDGTITTTGHAVVNVDPVADAPVLGVTLGAVPLTAILPLADEAGVPVGQTFLGSLKVDFDGLFSDPVLYGKPEDLAHVRGIMAGSTVLRFGAPVNDPVHGYGLSIPGGENVQDFADNTGTGSVKLLFDDGGPAQMTFSMYYSAGDEFVLDVGNWGEFTIDRSGATGSGPASHFSASVSEDQEIPLLITLSDPDTSESLEITVAGVPTGATLSAGTDNHDGTWTLEPTQLAGLHMTPPQDFKGDVQLQVTATSMDHTDTADTTVSLDIKVVPVGETPTLTSVDPAAVDEDAGTAIALDVHLDVHHDSTETLALHVEGVPDDATLSAGSKNPDGTWTLDPADLSGLTITPADQYAGSMALKFVATTIEATGETTTGSAFALVNVHPVIDTTPTVHDLMVSTSDAQHGFAVPAALQGWGLDSSEGFTIPGGHIVAQDDPSLTRIPENQLFLQLPDGASEANGWLVKVGSTGEMIFNWTRPDGSVVPVLPVAPDDLARVSVRPPQGYSGDMHFSLVGTVSDGTTHSDFNLPFQVTVGSSGSSDVTTDAVIDTAQIHLDADITGISGGSVTEDVAILDLGAAGEFLHDSGSLTATAADGSHLNFVEETIDNGEGSSLMMKADGSWEVRIDNSNPDVQALNHGEHFDQTFTVSAEDGTTHDIVISVYGTDDGPSPAPPPPADEPDNADTTSVSLVVDQPAVDDSPMADYLQFAVQDNHASLGHTDALTDDVATASGDHLVDMPGHDVTGSGDVMEAAEQAALHSDSHSQGGGTPLHEYLQFVGNAEHSPVNIPGIETSDHSILEGYMQAAGVGLHDLTTVEPPDFPVVDSGNELTDDSGHDHSHEQTAVDLDVVDVPPDELHQFVMDDAHHTYDS